MRIQSREGRYIEIKEVGDGLTTNETGQVKDCLTF